MNWKLIIISSLVGAFSSVVLGCLIFFGAPQLSNYNVEDYITVGVLICAGFASFAAYRRADARKILHAAIVFAAVWILCAAAIFFAALFLFVVCSLMSCRIIPFL